jgi:hypothetical protein
MRSHSIVPFTPFLAALALACAGETTDPGSPSAAGPQFRTASHPDGPGAFVIRSATTNAFLFSTPESNVTVISGLSLDQAAILCAGGDFTWDPAEQLMVVRPDGTIHVNFQATGATLLVYQGFFADFCANAPVATGTGKFIYSDNDAVFSGTRSDAFRFQVEGEAASAAGQRYHVLARFHTVYSRDGILQLFVDKVQVNDVGG